MAESSSSNKPKLRSHCSLPLLRVLVAAVSDTGIHVAAHCTSRQAVREGECIPSQQLGLACSDAKQSKTRRSLIIHGTICRWLQDQGDEQQSTYSFLCETAQLP